MPRIEDSEIERLARLALERAYVLLSDHRRWTTGCVARNSSGRHVSPAADEAVKWCAVGAIDRGVYDACKEAGLDVSLGDYAPHRIAEAAQRIYTPVLRDTVRTLNPTVHPQILAADIPVFNDSADWGYPVIVAAFAQVTGKGVTDAIARSVERVSRLRAAARKGWETRRRRLLEGLEAPQEPPAMVFGGTIAPSPAAEPERVEV